MAVNVYANLSDIEVFDKARDALLRVQALPDGNERRLQQEVFDSAMLELGWRAIMGSVREAEAAQ